jgi:hypothetical protein
MRTEHILALDASSSLTLANLRTANPELYQQVQERIASERSSVITAAFAGASQELRDVLRKIDLAPGDQLDCGLTQIILEGLTAQCAAPELLQEALARIRTLDGSSTLNAPAEVHLPIVEHRLFQHDLQQAALFKMADVVRLSDDKSSRVALNIGSLVTLNNEHLASRCSPR